MEQALHQHIGTTVAHHLHRQHGRLLVAFGSHIVYIFGRERGHRSLGLDLLAVAYKHDFGKAFVHGPRHGGDGTVVRTADYGQTNATPHLPQVSGEVIKGTDGLQRLQRLHGLLYECAY